MKKKKQKKTYNRMCINNILLGVNEHQGVLLLDVVVREGLAVLQLLSCEDEPMLV